MYNEQRIISLLESIEETNRKQLSYARMQFILSVISIVCCVALLAAGLTFLPQIISIISDVETVVSNLEAVTTTLTKSDYITVLNNINALITNIDNFVTTSQSGIEEALSKINSIDFDTLNQAIKDLADVIEPLVTFIKGLPFV